DSVGDVVDYLYDDAYYYLAIAANLADTGRSTLDGLTATNGYQPLWLIVLFLIGKLTGTHPWRFFVASCLLIYALAMGAMLLGVFWRGKTSRHIALSLTVGLAFATMRQPQVFLQGLEPILLLPLSVPLVVLLECAAAPRDCVLLSLVLAVAFLVRLDALALYLAVVAALTVPPLAAVQGDLLGKLQRHSLNERNA